MKTIESNITNPIFYDFLLQNISKGNHPDGWSGLIALSKVSEAYNEGYKEGFKESIDAGRKAIFSYLNTNIAQAFKGLEKYISILEKSYGIKCKQMFMKICDLEDFSGLIVISPSDFFSENMDRVYKSISKDLDIINDKNSRLDINFTFDGNALNENTLIADGFVFEYSTRKA